MRSLIKRIRKQENSFKQAQKLEIQARDNSESEQSSRLYARAYDVYRKIAENSFAERDVRGRASYFMYLLAKENKVTLYPAIYNETMVVTSEERCQKLLIWSANFGYPAAVSAGGVDIQPLILDSAQEKTVQVSEDSRTSNQKSKSSLYMDLQEEIGDYDAFSTGHLTPQGLDKLKHTLK